MDYIGAKTKLCDWIFSIIANNGIDKNHIFLDACSGSGAISKYAANLGYKVISNDLLKFSSVICSAIINFPKSKIDLVKFHIETINNTNSFVNGFFYENYSERANRLYFTNENACRIDYIRQYISNIVDEDIKNYLLYISLEAISAISNTTGVQAAFLKTYKKRALNPIKLQFKECLYLQNSIQYNMDIIDLLNKNICNENILYIDPPYNNRQYGPNYHLYETFIKNDNPVIKGKTGIRDWNESKSKFCYKNEASNFFKNIINITKANKVYISYNTDSLLSEDEMINIIGNKIVKVHKQEYKRYKSDNSSTRKYNSSNLQEILFEIIQ